MIVERHGLQVRFPPVPDATEVPYTYRAFTTGGWYEEQLLEHVRRQGRRGVYVDVGAHLGTHTAWFAALCPSTHVHAVEPVDRFADQIDRVVRANGLEQKVTVHRVGLSDQPGQASNRLSAEHQVGFDRAGGAAPRVESFPATTLDQLVSGPVAVIKIDVEGMEARVMAGAAKLVAAHQPTIYVEAWDRGQLRQVSRALKSEGYGPTGRVFNATATYEFAPSTAALRVLATSRLVARAAHIAARRAVEWVLRRAARREAGADSRPVDSVSRSVATADEELGRGGVPAAAEVGVGPQRAERYEADAG